MAGRRVEVLKVRGGGTLEKEARSRAGSGVSYCATAIWSQGLGPGRSWESQLHPECKPAQAPSAPAVGGGDRKPRPAQAPPPGGSRALRRSVAQLDPAGLSPLTSRLSTSLHLGPDMLLLQRTKHSGPGSFSKSCTEYVGNPWAARSPYLSLQSSPG